MGINIVIPKNEDGETTGQAAPLEIEEKTSVDFNNTSTEELIEI